MTKHSRGNTTLRHNTVQDMLVHILEEHKPNTKKPIIKREWDVESVMDYNARWVIDVADLTNNVYYEVETSQSNTASTRAKQLALAKHTRTDLIIIPAWQIDWDVWSAGQIEVWLRERVH